MKLLPTLLSLALLLPPGIAAFAQNNDPYPQGPDSKSQPGVPKGEVLHFTTEKSKIFPGSFRDYWVYVPAEYKPGDKTCLYVNQDGIQWNAPTVFDNLIFKKEMPVTIGVFVMHGRVRAADGKTALDRFNRSYEYDGLGDNYARYVIDELLPEVETKTTTDGRAIHFSHDGNDHAIGGSSSGAVAAFTAAWERPDAFSRVFSVIGTYVGLRGGNEYPTLIRKYEPKPLRVFLNDGSNDLNIYGGDWWMANQSMERALTFAGYEVDHVWGILGHDGRQGAAVFPDVMRYLWKDWPAPVKAGPSRNGMLNDIVSGDSSWQPASANELASSILALQTANRDVRKAADSLRGAASVTSRNGFAYIAARGGSRLPSSQIYLVRRDGKRQIVATGDQRSPTGLTLSPDQTLLYVADGASHWVWSYQIRPDGTLLDGQKYYWLHSPDNADDSGASAMSVDRDGRLYVATRLGVQVCDQAGRVNVILPVRQGQGVSSLLWGGANLDTLYAQVGESWFSRRMKVIGTRSWDAPNRPNPPGL